MSPNPDISPILVTGAAGRLGRHVVRHLHEAGHEVTASDQVKTTKFDCPFVLTDLRDHARATSLVREFRTVIHLGNIPGLKHPQTTFNDNVTINQNVFQAAAEGRASRVIFASTLQLIGSHLDARTVRHPPPPPSYPLDGSTPPQSANTYALSKSVSELMLRYYVERCGLDGVAVRYPLIIGPDYPPGLAEEPITDTIIREGFSVLSFDDAARLAKDIVEHPLPGFRIYSPGVSRRQPRYTNAELRRKFYPDLPASDDDLIDNSLITTDVGWTPSLSYATAP